MKRYIHIRWAVAVATAAVLWSLDGTFFRPQLYTLPAELVVFLEHLLWTILFAYFLGKWWKQIRLLWWKTWWALLRVSLFGGILWTLFITKAFFLAFDGSVTFATIILLQKLQPLFALSVAAILLKETLHRSFYLRAVVAIVAAFFLAFGSDALHVGAVEWFHTWALMALIASFSFGSSTVFSKYVVWHLDAKRTAGMRFLLTAVMMWLFLLVSWNGISVDAVSTIQWWYLSVIALSSWLVALFLYYRWLQNIKASQASIMELARPLSAIVLDWAINGNVLTITQFIAAGVLVIAMVQVSKQRE